MKKLLHAIARYDALYRWGPAPTEEHWSIPLIKQLIAALEGQTIQGATLPFLLGHFESTMMGYVDSVTPLEEKDLLPQGFSAHLIRTVRAIREDLHPK
ncbi:hypothetical protein [Prosthecobacter sp.]|uniref:hypothetical protein n=1 Tax=Prosthecobacter sp. TaxID=1965333 RepID=UPI00378499F1